MSQKVLEKKFIKYTLVENPVASSNRVSDCYRPIKAIVTGERQRAAAVAVHERVAKFL
ncbi:TPA: hypothetical protein ACFRHE_000616 [Neisseria lactamica]|uniref:hypothetical protein n=1 Tax=Neisseria lactamica TaxID=486 RepID=UPI001305252E|nr:hypothetical protein [Neisseria lactamica]